MSDLGLGGGLATHTPRFMVTDVRRGREGAV